MSTHNTLCWTDIPVKDLDRAIAFYAAVLAANVDKHPFPGGEIGVLPHTESNASGCLVLSENNQPSQNGPLIYLSVEGRLDAALKTAGERGGRVVEEKHPIGPYGFKGVILDSEGNRIALHSQSA